MSFELGRGTFFKYWVITSPGARTPEIGHGSNNYITTLPRAERISKKNGKFTTVVEVKGTFIP